LNWHEKAYRILRGGVAATRMCHGKLRFHNILAVRCRYIRIMRIFGTPRKTPRKKAADKKQSERIIGWH
jgi:hypothetical protein